MAVEIRESNTNLQVNEKDQISKLRKRNSLVENNMVAQWVDEVFTIEMDKYAFVRSMMMFALISFSLGNNLNHFLWLFIIISVYIIVLRIIRWWVIRYLLYLFEFCYFGLVYLIVFLCKYQKDKVVWCTAYVFSTGNMATAILLLSNQAQFGSTDHISSAWLHTMPLITVWAIRWRELIYPPEMLKALTFDFLPVKDMSLSTRSENIQFLVLNPLMFWGVWVVSYIFLFFICFGSYIDDKRYMHGLKDFVYRISKYNLPCIGDATKYTKLKYLCQHLLIYVGSIPLAWISYHNFYFNTGYLLALMVFLIWNAGRQQSKFINKKISERLVKAGITDAENAENSEIK